MNQILADFISAHRPGLWKLGSDSSRPYCCHISWFAGPEEKPRDPYDVHHIIRRRIEVTLETDGLCNPTGYRIVNYEAIEKTVHVGLEPQNLVEGILAVMGQDSERSDNPGVREFQDIASRIREIYKKCP